MPSQFPRSRVLLVCLLAVLVSGCSMVVGGNNNPRPDLPNTTRPAAPVGADTWSALDWQSATFEQPAKTSIEQWDQATAVAAGSGGWVAVGSNSDVTGYEGRIWQSVDSLSWKLVHSDLLKSLELVDVAATADAFVAIGTDSANPNDATTSILYSTDGLSWAEVESVEDAWAARVASSPRGFATIVQADNSNDLLLSSDGRTWSRVAGADIGEDASIADIAWDGAGWIAVGSARNRAVVLRSPDGATWVEEALPASEPVDGILDVSAYRVIPGRWAILVLGLDRGPSCAEDDDWCDRYQAAWSWTAESGWMRLPRSNWLLGLGYGVDATVAGDAGFLYLLGDDVRTSANGWEWAPVKQSASTEAFANAAIVTDDRVVAVGSLSGGDVLAGWFGSGLIGR